METENKSLKIHPLIAVAAIALIVACLVGIAAMIGILPNFNKTASPVASTNVVAADTSISAPIAAPTKALPQPETPAPAPKVVHKKPEKKPVNSTASTTRRYYDSPNVASCSNCGVVESVNAIEHQAPTSGVGLGVGAVVGGLLGNQVGGGNGRTLATIAGAVGGGYAGNAIEKNRHTSTSYEVVVRMEDGGRQRFTMNEQRWRSGDLVRVDNGNLSAR